MLGKAINATLGTLSFGKPLYSDVRADRAYLIYPVTFTDAPNGKKVTYKGHHDRHAGENAAWLGVHGRGVGLDCVTNPGFARGSNPYRMVKGLDHQPWVR